jgi:hypothetical protein
MNTVTHDAPRIGDRVIPLPDQYGNWHGIDEFYRNQIGVITNVGTPNHEGRSTLRAEFKSRQKPDDTIEWSFYDWRPAPGEGDTVIVSQTGPTNLQGKIGTVKINDRSEIPYYVTGVYDDDAESGMWFYAHQIEVVLDGSTLTTSYTPAVGDYVRFTAILDAAGIVDSHVGSGVVIEASGGVYTVQTGRERAVVTGTGCIFPDTTIVRRMGEKVTMWSQDPTVPSSLIGKEGVITGWYEALNSPLVTFPRDAQQYGNVFPGSWVVGEQYLTETPAAPVEPAILTDLQAQIDRLERDLTAARENNRILMTSVEDWTHDFDAYAEEVRDEAVQREWCSEYEGVMDRIRTRLRVATIPERVKLVEKRVRIRGEVYRDVTVWVPEGDDASDSDNWYESDDVDDKCSEEFMTQQIESEFENNGWDETTISVLR